MTDAVPPPLSADAPASDQPRGSDHDVGTPHARHATPMEDGHDQLIEKHRAAEDRQEALVDESLEETFPASDPASAGNIT